MYISEIEVVRYHADRGIGCNTLSEVAEAVRLLGELCSEQPEDVERLIRAMYKSMLYDVTYSALAEYMVSRSARSGRNTPIRDASGNRAYTDGLVFGGKFFVHNDLGLTRYSPFRDLTIRVNTLPPAEKNGPERYTLTVTDQDQSLPGHHPLNHTETTLAMRMGQTRTITHIMVDVLYTQAGPKVEFDVSNLLTALGSIDGLDAISITAGRLSEVYFANMAAPLSTGTDHQLVVQHANGAQVTLCGFFGIETHDGTIGRRQLVKLDGAVISGPPSRFSKPHVTLRIDRGNTPSNDDLTSLADTLSGALWSYNY